MHDRLRAWEARGRYLDVGGRRVFVWETGRGRPLLALHGFPVSSYDWRVVAERLPHRRFVALDFFGFGLSDKSPRAGYSLFGQADMVEDVVAALGIDRCDLVAHDMGDSVAAELMKRAAEQSLSFGLDSVVLTNGSIFIDLAQLTSGQKLFLRLPARRLPFSPPVRPFRRQLRSLFSVQHPVDDEELEMMELLLRHDGGSRIVPITIRYIEERRANSNRWTSPLVDFPGPLGVVWGEQDPVAVPAMVDRLADLRDEVDVVRWGDVGHWPQLEVPDRLAAEIDRLTSHH